MTLTPELYDAILEEAHKYNVPVGVHNITLKDAKEMMRHGMEGWLHVPVRGGEVDNELIGIVKQRIANNDRPVSVDDAGPDHRLDERLLKADFPDGRACSLQLDDPCCATHAPAQVVAFWGQSRKQGIINRYIARDFELLGKNASDAARRRHADRQRHRRSTGQSQFLDRLFQRLLTWKAWW